MRTIHDLPTPALLLDVAVLEDNLRRMQDRTRELGVSLRPHLKTHKCVEIARAQVALGARGVTVSTLYEARVFADHGFDDITWAFPLPAQRAGDVAELGRRCRLGVVVDHDLAVDALEAAEASCSVWLKVDCGYGRAGLAPEDDDLARLVDRVCASNSLTFAGLLSHSGHAYHARSPRDAARIAESERRLMAETAESLTTRGLTVPAVSVGSTPSLSHSRGYEGVSEVRPGNYALYDFTQVALGSCESDQCAATVLASVVSSHGGRGRSIIDAGALSLSLDPGPKHVTSSYGPLYDVGGPADGVRHNARLVSLSQEHGIVDQALPMGLRVRVLPNHSCLTIACFDAYYVVDGEDVVDSWRIWRGR